MLMSGQDYRESLRRYHPQVFVNGQPIASVVDGPLLRNRLSGSRRATSGVAILIVTVIQSPISYSVFQRLTGFLHSRE